MQPPGHCAQLWAECQPNQIWWRWLCSDYGPELKYQRSGLEDNQPNFGRVECNPLESSAGPKLGAPAGRCGDGP